MKNKKNVIFVFVDFAIGENAIIIFVKIYMRLK